jgi:hypothetical protein
MVYRLRSGTEDRRAEQPKETRFSLKNSRLMDCVANEVVEYPETLVLRSAAHRRQGRNEGIRVIEDLLLAKRERKRGIDKAENPQA